MKTLDSFLQSLVFFAWLFSIYAEAEEHSETFATDILMFFFQVNQDPYSLKLEVTGIIEGPILG